MAKLKNNIALRYKVEFWIATRLILYLSKGNQQRVLSMYFWAYQ